MYYQEEVIMSAVIAPIFPFNPILPSLGSFGPLITPIHLPAKHRLPTSAKQYLYKLPQQTAIQTLYPSKPFFLTLPSSNAPTLNNTPLLISSSYHLTIYISDEKEEIIA